MDNALLEIFTEHLPARFLIPSLEQMRLSAAGILNKHNLKFVSLRTYGTFRRLVLEIDGLASKSEDIQKEVKGPPAKLLKDASGNYTPQAAGFAEKNGLKPEELLTIETDKGPFIYAKIKIKGSAAVKLLPEIFTEIIKNLTFAKNMVWEDSGFKFARPIRSLIGLYGSKIVPFEIEIFY
jgi:glycyl-tRNA synthetase beta chain